MGELTLARTVLGYNWDTMPEALPRDHLRKRHNIVMAENAELRSALWAIRNAYDHSHCAPLTTLKEAQGIATETLERVKL